MKVISIINYKGGVGKTTITANLASELTFRKKRVLAIDLDPQSNLTFSFVKVDDWRDKYENDKTIKFWFDSLIDNQNNIPDFKQLIVRLQDIDFIFSHLGLIDVDIELAAGFSSSTERQHKSNFLKTYSYIRNELDKLKGEYDVVLFDCPPNFSIVTRNALIASDYYIVPAKMDYLSTLGINQLRNHVNTLVQQFNKYADGSDYRQIAPEFLGVIATMIGVKNGGPYKTQQTYINTLKRNNIGIFDSMIRENKTIYADAPEIMQPVVSQRHRPNTTYGQVVSELEDLTTEFINKIGV